MQLHIPLPNVKVPSDGLDLRTKHTVTIQNTGEMDAVLTFASSDAAFTVPSGQVKVASKGTYDLNVAYSGQNASTATITVKSNDPDSPEQTFEVAANGAQLSKPNGGDGSSPSETGSDGTAGQQSTESSGCSAAPRSDAAGRSTGALLALGLALATALRRRRR